MSEGDFFVVVDAVDGLLATHVTEAARFGEVLHEGGHVEDDVLAIHPCADTQGAVRHPSVFVGGMPSLLEGGLELLEQDLWVVGDPLLFPFVPLRHRDAEFRHTATDCMTPTGAPWVNGEFVVVEPPRREGEAWVSRCEQDGVTAVSKGAAIGLSDEAEVRVLESLHVSVCSEVSKVEVVALCEVFYLVFVDAEHAVIHVCADVHHVIVDSCDFCLGHSASNLVDVGNCLLILRHVCECLNVRDTGGIEPPMVAYRVASTRLAYDGHIHPVCVLDRFCLSRS